MLDKYIGTSNYREHVFLQHPMVPDQVKSSLTRVLELHLTDRELKASVIKKIFSGCQNVSVLQVILGPGLKFRFDPAIENQMQKIFT